MLISAIPFRRLPALLVMLGATFLLASCDPVLDTVTATKIVIAAEGNATAIGVDGGTLQMRVVEIEPQASNTSISWYVTYGTGMASITRNGLISADAEGTVEVFASDGRAVSNKIRLSIGPQTPGWKVFGPVSDDDSREWDATTAIDANGRVYRAYWKKLSGEYSKEEPIVEYFDGTVWKSLGDAFTGGASAYQFSFALAPNGDPYIAYVFFDDSSYSVSVKRWNGTSWITVGTHETTRDSYLRIEIGSDGTVYLVNDEYSPLIYRLSGGQWKNISGDLSGTDKDISSISAASDGALYIALTNYSNAPRVGRYSGTVWTSLGGGELPQATDGYPWLALDSAGVPYTAYYDESGGVTVRKYDETGDQWALVGAAGFAPYAHGVRLTLGDDDTPYFACKDIDNGRISVRKFDGAAWTLVGNADFSAPIYGAPSLAVHPDRRPFVAFTKKIDNNEGPTFVMVYR